ncbi:hypothetical protein JY27_10905 [Neisseria meningitidis]|nr:hypothetical protein JY27_10905 [Neisseria meningitidis]
MQRKTVPDSIDIINRTYQFWSYLKYNSVILLYPLNHMLQLNVVLALALIEDCEFLIQSQILLHLCKHLHKFQ